MKASFEYYGNIFEILNFTHSVEDENTGNPYNCSFGIKIVSGNFSGYADNCEYDYKEWKKFINQLEALYNFKIKEVKMVEIGLGSTVLFRIDNLGHIEISGVIYGEAKEQSLTFAFEIDQTVLYDFLGELKKL
jgi:hypothetical protein